MVMDSLEDLETPQELFCKIISRDPYKLHTGNGELNLPEELVLEKLKMPPREPYHVNLFFAQITADDDKTITSFVFNDYLKKALKDIELIHSLDFLPPGKWPRRKILS